MTDGVDRPGDLNGAENDRTARPFDPGLQPERTALAWRRTALALVVAAIVGIRVLPSLLGAWAIVPAGLGVVLALIIFAASHLRYRAHHHRLTSADTDRIALPGGALPALMTLTALAGGVASLAVALIASL